MARKNTAKFVTAGSVGAERMAFRAGRANAAGTMQDSRTHRLNTRGARDAAAFGEYVLGANVDDFDPSDPFDKYAEYL